MNENYDDELYLMVDEDDEDIYHHGVKGMKWGVRRTPAQLGHKVISGGKKAISVTKRISKRAKRAFARVEARRKAKKAEREKEELKKEEANKPISQLSDAELAKRIQRMQMEKQALGYQKDINDLNAALNPEKKSQGKAVVEKLLNEKLAPGVVDVGIKALEKKLGLTKEAEINWDSKLKEQQYKQNEANKGKTDWKEKQEQIKYLKEKLSYQKQKDDYDKKHSDSSDSDGGAGKNSGSGSNKNSGNNSNKESKNTKQKYTTPIVDIVTPSNTKSGIDFVKVFNTMDPSSTVKGNDGVMYAGTRYVQLLLEDKSER